MKLFFFSGVGCYLQTDAVVFSCVLILTQASAGQETYVAKAVVPGLGQTFIHTH